MEYLINFLLGLGVWAVIAWFIVVVALPLIAIIDCCFNKLPVFYKIIWVLILFFVPLLGFLAYFTAHTPKTEHPIIKKHTYIFK